MTLANAPTASGNQELSFIEPDWFNKINDEYRLMGSYCAKCGKTSFPHKPFCPSCYERNQQTVPLSTTGTLHTFALSVMGPKEMAKPYVIGFIDLPEGIKLYSIINTQKPWDQVLKVGMKMVMEIGKIKTDADGNDIFGYWFVPKKETK